MIKIIIALTASLSDTSANVKKQKQTITTYVNMNKAYCLFFFLLGMWSTLEKKNMYVRTYVCTCIHFFTIIITALCDTAVSWNLANAECAFSCMLNFEPRKSHRRR